MSFTVQRGKATPLTFSPTPEQQEVCDAVASRGGESVMISARAGCSKTTTLQLAAPRISAPALALAFNRKNAKDLEPRLPANFSVKTMNGLGHGAWQRQVAQQGVNKLEIDDKKLGKLVSQTAKDRKVALSSDQWGDLRALVSGAMQVGLAPRDEGQPLTPDTPEAWRDIADGLWIPRDDFEFLKDLAHETLERSIALAQQGIISFDDQVYCSVCLGGRFPKFPVVFIDEAQDLNPLNHAMLSLALREGGRLVAVGDEAQAIYAFRGASGDSMQRIRQLRPKWIDRPLNTTFRCPKTIVARQQGHVPGFKAHQSNPEGRFASLPDGREEFDQDGNLQGWDWNRVMELRSRPDGDIAVLCRNNAPLLSMAFKLIRQRVGVQILGQDIGKGLITLSKKICKADDLPAPQCAGLINEWRERELALARANDNDARQETVQDQADCLQAVLADAECRDAGQLRQMLAHLFAREGGLVTLSSVHRAKGLEFDTVVNLDPFRIPSRQAKAAALLGNDLPMKQERNLLYVLETRAKHTLINANLEDFQSNG